MNVYEASTRPTHCPACGSGCRVVENREGWVVACFTCGDWHCVERKEE